MVARVVFLDARLHTVLEDVSLPTWEAPKAHAELLQ